MRVVEMMMNYIHRDRRPVERIDEHTGEVKHDLTNLKARIDVISRLVMQMQADGSRQK